MVGLKHGVSRGSAHMCVTFMLKQSCLIDMYAASSRVPNMRFDAYSLIDTLSQITLLFKV